MIWCARNMIILTLQRTHARKLIPGLVHAFGILRRRIRAPKIHLRWISSFPSIFINLVAFCNITEPMSKCYWNWSRPIGLCPNAVWSGDGRAARCQLDRRLQSSSDVMCRTARSRQCGVSSAETIKTTTTSTPSNERCRNC